MATVANEEDEVFDPQLLISLYNTIAQGEKIVPLGCEWPVTTHAVVAKESCSDTVTNINECAEQEKKNFLLRQSFGFQDPGFAKEPSRKKNEGLTRPPVGAVVKFAHLDTVIYSLQSSKLIVQQQQSSGQSVSVHVEPKKSTAEEDVLLN